MYKIDKIVEPYFEMDYIVDHLNAVGPLCKEVEGAFASGDPSIRECLDKLREALDHQAKACMATIVLSKRCPKFFKERKDQMKMTFDGYYELKKVVSNLEGAL